MTVRSTGVVSSSYKEIYMKMIIVSIRIEFRIYDYGSDSPLPFELMLVDVYWEHNEPQLKSTDRRWDSHRIWIRALVLRLDLDTLVQPTELSRVKWIVAVFFIYKRSPCVDTG